MAAVLIALDAAHQADPDVELDRVDVTQRAGRDGGGEEPTEDRGEHELVPRPEPGALELRGGQQRVSGVGQQANGTTALCMMGMTSSTYPCASKRRRRPV